MHRAKGDWLVRASVLPVCDNDFSGTIKVANSEGVQGVRLNPPLRYIILLYENRVDPGHAALTRAA